MEKLMMMGIKKKQESYYELFPSADKNVKVKEIVHGTTGSGKTMIRRGLVITKSFKAGEVIYSEKPVVAQLNSPTMDFCEYCLKDLSKLGPDDLVSCDHCDKAQYCCSTCQKTAWAEYHKFACAATDLTEYTVESKSKIALMVLKFMGRVIKEDQENPESASESTYSIFDHVDRLQFLELKPSATDEKELAMVLSAFGTKVPQFDAFLTMERYMMLKGRFIYNAIGISFPTTNTVLPASSDNVRSSTSDPASGSGVYQVSSYISHSCSPNSTIRFTGDSQLELVADSDLNDGDEIFVSWIAKGKDGRSRREELHAKYRFRCQCPTCASES
ncbi:hypothetical protein SmJEL517_g03204 [Synchytrium microbalum]|uniref:SET domain-containing protein n=1 Tax=Synchytrium microbalum TaxID=1806994 RepID=A0A507C8X5_9FUNG|nr:uncharacterized protein SmJEL517_g03204 [Synchytrium microbalum]TPX33983.1 hypothetical protein SmJEL517_g03204 [Synchytrium microbalum]